MSSSNRHKLAKIAFFALVYGVLIVAISIAGQAQTVFSAPGAPRCVQRPETLLGQPLGGQVVWSRFNGTLRPYDAAGLLATLNQAPAYRTEAASVAIQLSISLDQSGALRDAPIAAWLDDPGIPAISLQGAVRFFLWTWHPPQRNQYGQWLVRIVQSQLNATCNED